MKQRGGTTPVPAQKPTECVKVVVRCRPFSDGERAEKYQACVHVDETLGSIRVVRPGEDASLAKQYTFDSVYGMSSQQVSIYEETARPIVMASLEGYNGTIFAYGQTGTGKTFTMEGIYTEKDKRGIIPNSFAHIFQYIDDAPKTSKYLVRASYLEIYNEEIRDLLSKNYKRKLEIREHAKTGVYVKDLSNFVVKSAAEIDAVMIAGKKLRHTGATKMNAESSRSHSVFTIIIECSDVGPDGGEHIRVGRLNLVDLAGSERQSKTEASGDRLEEAVNINLSLTCLGNVIEALAQGKDGGYIPYRNSKLTRLLQNSLGGNAKTVMVANVGPTNYNYEETLSTLRYANRAKNIKNKPVINEDPKDAMLRQYQEEIERLKRELMGVRGSGATSPMTVRGDDGEVIPYGTEGYTVAMMKNLEAKLSEEKERILADKSKSEDEKARLQKEVEDRQVKLQEERARTEELATLLRRMEEKVLQGGENIIEHAEKQAAELERIRMDREREERERIRLEHELRERQNDIDDERKAFASLQEEVEIKSQKLRKLWDKLQAAKAEIEDLHAENDQEKEDLVTEIRRQTKELLLCHVIVKNFIPPDEVEKVRRRARWNEDREDYELVREAYGSLPLLPRPSPTSGQRRWLCDFSKKMASMPGANLARFKPDNIMALGLDHPERTTMDYEGPKVPAGVQAALDAALAEEGEMTFAAPENLPSLSRPSANGPAVAKKSGDNRPVSKTRPPSARGSDRDRGAPAASRAPAKAPAPGADYPQSRGHVVGQRRR